MNKPREFGSRPLKPSEQGKNKMKLKLNKNGLQLLNDFEVGQIEVIKWAKANIMRQITEIENKDAGYLLRDTKTDALHCLKLVLQKEIWQFMLNQFNEKELEITQNHED